MIEFIAGIAAWRWAKKKLDTIKVPAAIDTDLQTKYQAANMLAANLAEQVVALENRLQGWQVFAILETFLILGFIIWRKL